MSEVKSEIKLVITVTVNRIYHEYMNIYFH